MKAAKDAVTWRSTSCRSLLMSNSPALKERGLPEPMRPERRTHPTKWGLTALFFRNPVWLGDEKNRNTNTYHFYFCWGGGASTNKKVTGPRIQTTVCNDVLVGRGKWRKVKATCTQQLKKAVGVKQTKPNQYLGVGQKFG